jgi:hypothetical protein
MRVCVMVELLLAELMPLSLLAKEQNTGRLLANLCKRPATCLVGLLLQPKVQRAGLTTS